MMCLQGAVAVEGEAVLWRPDSDGPPWAPASRLGSDMGSSASSDDDQGDVLPMDPSSPISMNAQETNQLHTKAQLSPSAVSHRASSSGYQAKSSIEVPGATSIDLQRPADRNLCDVSSGALPRGSLGVPYDWLVTIPGPEGQDPQAVSRDIGPVAYILPSTDIKLAGQQPPREADNALPSIVDVGPGLRGKRNEQSRRTGGNKSAPEHMARLLPWLPDVVSKARRLLGAGPITHGVSAETIQSGEGT